MLKNIAILVLLLSLIFAEGAHWLMRQELQELREYKQKAEFCITSAMTGP